MEEFIGGCKGTEKIWRLQARPGTRAQEPESWEGTAVTTRGSRTAVFDHVLQAGWDRRDAKRASQRCAPGSLHTGFPRCAEGRKRETRISCVFFWLGLLPLCLAWKTGRNTF